MSLSGIVIRHPVILRGEWLEEDEPDAFIIQSAIDHALAAHRSSRYQSHSYFVESGRLHIDVWLAK